MFELIFLEEANQDLLAIAEYYVIEFGSHSAQKVIAVIKKSISRLIIFPDSGSLTPDEVLNEQGYRMVISEQFVTVYRVVDELVYIYRIFNTYQEYTTLF